jgi:protein-tyrosine-phosphatase
MATVMMRSRCPHHETQGAGTFSISGLPMSQRTRTALSKFNLSNPNHRSHQLEERDCEWADLIMIFEKEHHEYIARNHTKFLSIVSSLPRLIRDLGDNYQNLALRLKELNLDREKFEPWEEITDPAGGDQDVFDSCATEISILIDQLALRI